MERKFEAWGLIAMFVAAVSVVAIAFLIILDYLADTRSGQSVKVDRPPGISGTAAQNR